MSDGLDARQQHRNHFHLALFTLLRGHDDRGLLLIGGDVARSRLGHAQQHIDDVRVLRAEVDRLTLGRLARKEADDHSPAKVMIQILDGDQPTRLHEAQRVIRMVDDISHILGICLKLLSKVVVFTDDGFIRDVQAEPFFLELGQL